MPPALFTFPKPALLALFILLLSASLAFHSNAQLNFDTALTPPKGGTILRTQWRNAELSTQDPSSHPDISANSLSLTGVYGITSDLAFLGSFPVLWQDAQNNENTGTESGFGDFTTLLRYTFYKADSPGITRRFNVFTGLEIPSQDSPFSSDSYNPILGLVYTYQNQNWFFAANAQHKFNTGSGLNADDQFRIDLALLPRLAHGQIQGIGPWGLYAVAELNSFYITDGSFLFYGSPGIEFITTRFVIEAAIQLPLVNEAASPRPEPDYTFVFGIRLQF